MWRESSARSVSSGDQFLDQKLPHHVGMTTRSRELSSCSVQSRTFDASSELAEAFRYFDRNGVGKISAVELGLVLCSLGITYTDAELEMMVNEVDADGDGFIDLQEFINLNRLASKATLGADSENNSDVEPALRDAFHVFDVEKKGYISADALHRVLSGLGDDDGLTLEDCRRMINSVDQDGDGLVDFNDFQLMMQHDNLVC
jgi:calcium-binding protein CML